MGVRITCLCPITACSINHMILNLVRILRKIEEDRNEWNQKVSLSSSSQLYKEIKSTIDIRSYHDKSKNIKYRKAIFVA